MSEVSDDRHFTMSIPLDDDGFLRRECPNCKREFKWLSSEDANAEAVAPDPAGYYCPYCGLQAPLDAWWTKEQLEHMQAIVTEEMVAPELEKLKKALESSSGGFLKVSAEVSTPDPPASEMTEPDDMVRADFRCHPSEPLKVAETWNEPVYCLICGARMERS
jgi:hypothetical protein